ncbi:MAG: hypothetical protein OXG96_13625 [Acidobacteria bacterium]|nr:hypothetical protein [Acidobacteriota bacterium]
MWIFVLALVYFLPIFNGSLPPFQEPTPRNIVGKATAIDVDLLEIDGCIVELRGVKSVTYKRRREELEPLFYMGVMLNGEPVRCEDLEKCNVLGKQWFLGTCYLEGKSTEVDLNQWIVANGFAKSFGNDDYLEDEQAAKELGLGMWRRRTGTRPFFRSPRAEQSDSDRPLRTGEGSDC